MRIGLVTPYSWTVPGGVNHHVEHLAAELEERGHEAWIMAPVGAMSLFSRRSVDGHRNAVAERFIPMGAAFSFPANGSRAHMAISPHAFWRVEQALRYHHFDLLHVHEPCVPMISPAAILLADVPVVGTFHAALERSFGYEHLRSLVVALMRRIDVRIAVSEAARDYPARCYPGEYRIIPNGIAAEKYAPAVGARKVEGRILFIGRAEQRKGLGVLLDAFAEVRARLPHASLVVAGATLAEVAEAARARRRPPDLAGVEALGWVVEEQKVAQLAAAQVVCTPSLAGESFGIVLAEAMAAGVPVVASDLPGYRAVLQDGEAGRLVPPNQPAQLAAALLELLNEEALRRKLVAAGLVAADRLSWKYVTDAIMQSYDDAIVRMQRSGRLRQPRLARLLSGSLYGSVRRGSGGGA